MRRLALVALIACAACGARPRPVERGAVVARVDGEAIHEDVVRATAAREGVDARAALRMLIDEAILAREARRRGLAEPWVEESARWHALVSRLIEVEVEAPITRENSPAEMLDEHVASRRAQVCHDGLRRTAHVVFKVPRNPTAAQRASARAAAESFRREVVARFGERPTDEQLLGAGRAVTGREVAAEQLPGIDRYGGQVTGGNVVVPYARGIWAIDAARPLSEVFETSFGFHVALLLEEVPPAGVSCDLLRPRLAEELVTMRRARALHDLVARLRARADFRVDRAALAAAEANATR